jgi:HD-GYP domain-containing protein (c-di-GMP phosphodiesterase class II)
MNSKDFEYKQISLVKVPLEEIKNIINVEAYQLLKDGTIRLYKPKGKPIPQKKIDEHRVPELYVSPSDLRPFRIEYMQQLNKKLSFAINGKKDIDSIVQATKDIMVTVLKDPEDGSINQIPETADLLLKSIYLDPFVLTEFVKIQMWGEDLAMHLINVMGLVMKYCLYKNYTKETSKPYLIGALLHDIGQVKLGIDFYDKELTDEEYKKYTNHPIVAAKIMQAEGRDEFNEPIIGVSEHHELEDKSGYPNKKKPSFEISRVISIADDYDNLTSFRGKQLDKIDALKLIREEVNKGLRDKKIFEDFVNSLKKA